MNSTNSNSSIRMVLVAEKSDRRLMRLQTALDAAAVAHSLCRDIYSALREVLSGGGHVLVAGELSELCRQNARFVEICAIRGIPCVGWLPTRPSRQIVRGLDAAVRAGIEIVGDSEALQRIVERYLYQFQSAGTKSGNESVGVLRREEALLTEQELAALFGDT